MGSARKGDHPSEPDISSEGDFAMRRRLIATCLAAGLLALASPASAAKPPTHWDGLTQFKAKNFDYAYLLPGADFRNYTKVMLEPTDVAFHKDWRRDYNSRTSAGLDRLTDEESRKILEAVRSGFDEVFEAAYREAGYQLVTEAAPDVLMVSTGVFNLSIAAPDTMSTGRTLTNTAGGASVVVEVRDSMSGALLGRAVDSRSTGDTGLPIRNRITNTADFMRLFRRWAQISVEGLAVLKARSPIPE
jgi:hypothetical protein